jgi:hypothetical protein
MIDHGEGATRTWNALWWAENPFFVEPLSGNPGWFYLMGPMIMVTKEIFYTPIITMILTVTLAGIFIFKISLLFSNYRTAMIVLFSHLTRQYSGLTSLQSRSNYTLLPFA